VNDRERFLDLMAFRPADRFPLVEIEAYEEPTLARWRQEGLPPDRSPADVLGMGGFYHLPVDFFPVPAYEEEVLEENDEYAVVRNSYGAIVRRPKGRTDYAYEGFVDFAVKNRDDWLAHRRRFDGPVRERLPDDWGPELWDRTNALGQPVGLVIHPFFFRLGLYAMGLENFLRAFYEQPALLREMFEHRADMTLKILDEVLAHVRLDYACIAEDLAYRSGPHISPAMYREFWSPYQPAVIDRLRRGNVPVIAMWSSGDLRPILPALIEAGFNAAWPCEAFCDMHVVDLHREFGRDMAFVGNIGIRAVAEGKDAIDREIETKVLPMRDQGGYLPTLDDQAPPDVPWENYRYYIDRLRDL